MFCATLSRERATKKEGCHIETEEKIAAGVIERREEKNRHIIGCLLPSSLPLSLFPPSGRQPLLHLIYSYSANLDHLPPNKCLSTSRNGKKEFYIRCVSFVYIASQLRLRLQATTRSTDHSRLSLPLEIVYHVSYTFHLVFCFFLTHCHIHEAKIRSL